MKFFNRFKRKKPFTTLTDEQRTLEHYRQIIEQQMREMETLKKTLRELGK